jgi:protease PrsW
MDVCRVCSRPATQKLGQYAFCDEHYKKAVHQRKGLWRVDLLTILLLVVFVILVFLFSTLAKPVLNEGSLIAAGIILALVPAALWLWFFYRRDQLEPEPKSMVVEVFILGALVAGALAIPLVDSVFHVNDWLYSSLATQILGGILVVGFIQEFLKYAAVRFSVYKSDEFDERTDGVIYSTAAGLGFATALNIAFVVNSGGVDLGLGAIRVVVTALAQASFAGIVGYFLAKEKLEGKPIWWMPLGVTIAAILNGLFFFLRGKLTTGSIEAAAGFNSSWIGLALAAVLTLAITYLLSYLTQRDVERTLAQKEE